MNLSVSLHRLSAESIQEDRHDGQLFETGGSLCVSVRASSTQEVQLWFDGHEGLRGFAEKLLELDARPTTKG
jgi:hypothetical protein